MFGKKKCCEQADLFLVSPPEPVLRASVLVCRDCGCLVDRAFAKTVVQHSMFRHEFYYCARCKPPYDIIRFCAGKAVYERWVEGCHLAVTKDGKEIKPSRKKKNA